MSREPAKEHIIPLSLLGTGIVILLFVVFRRAGQNGVEQIIGPLATAIAVNVVLMLIGAVVTAKLIGVSFGAPAAAAVKLAAICVFPAALSELINVAGFSWLVSVALYFILLIYLFEMDAKEALIFTGVLIIIRVLIILMRIV